MGWRGTRTKVDCCKCTRPWGSFLHQQSSGYSPFTTTVCCPLSEHSLQRREMRNIQTAQKSARIQMQKHTRSYVSSREHTHTCHTPPYPVFHFSFHLFNNHIWWISIKVCFYKKLLFSKVQFCIILKSKSKWNLPHIRPISHPFFGKEICIKGTFEVQCKLGSIKKKKKKATSTKTKRSWPGTTIK